eukprot:8446162-Lingulodinium_polyedra.AAC.1
MARSAPMSKEQQQQQQQQQLRDARRDVGRALLLAQSLVRNKSYVDSRLIMRDANGRGQSRAFLPAQSARARR